MDSKILAEAKKDIPLYFNDFKVFWDSTTSHFTDKDLIECYATSLIFRNWLISLNHVSIKNLDGILNELHEDINASFFHAYFGHYRSAHMHLRSVIELSLQLVYFHQHEVEYELWKVGEFRIKHDELTNYLKKHPNLNGENTRNLIDNITRDWKLFSKHIHAEAPKFFQTNLQSRRTKKIVKADFGVWKGNFLQTGYQVNKLLLLFFKIKLNAFPTQNRDLLIRNLKSGDLAIFDIK
jgi:hypothetical protein